MTGSDCGDLIVFDSIDSTNDEVRRRVAAGQTGPLWIAARRQVAGRGRRGRGWSSEPGNLAATLLTAVPGGPADAALYSFVAALAVADTLDTLAPRQSVALKWPNDVLLNGRKACGILLESLGRAAEGGTVLAAGIGLNLAHHPAPAGANWPPTSILAETGEAPEFGRALAELVRAMDRRVTQRTDGGFAATRSDWLDRAIGLGQEIRVRLPKRSLTGRFAGLDRTGALVLEQDTGRRLIAAGDVFFPEAS